MASLVLKHSSAVLGRDYRVDIVSKRRRSDIMRQVRSTNTKPERAVRRLAHAMGYRFRLHRSDLPGKPDLVFPSRHAVIFVHGCFWHQHARCRAGRVPSSNRDYWEPKFARNVARDRTNSRRLRALGWRVLTVWECQVANKSLSTRLTRFLSRPTPRGPAVAS